MSTWGLCRSFIPKGRPVGGHSEGGSAALMFCVLFLPLLFLLFTLFLDVTSYFRQQQRAQQVLDEAVQHASRFLPRVALARQAVLDYVARALDSGVAPEVEVDSDHVFASLQESVPLSFAQFFIPGVGVRYQALASARISPIDVYIAVDVSRLVAPASPSETDQFLHTSLFSSFFAHDFPALFPEVDQDPRYLTALCFNRVFSAIKRTALGIHAIAAGSMLNRAGMGVYPSQYALRDVRRSGIVQDVVASGMSEGLFPEYHRIDGDAEWCAAAAQFERVALHEFGFPTVPRDIPVHFLPGSSTEIVDGDAQLIPENLPSLRAADALWAAVAHAEFPQTDVVLHEVRSRLAPMHSSARGGLTNSSEQIGIVISSDVPWIFDGAAYHRFGSHSQVESALKSALGGYRELAQQSPSRRFQLFYVILLDERTRDEVRTHQGALDRTFREVAEDAFLGGVLPNLALRVLFVESPEEAVAKLSAALAMSGRQSVLAR